MRYTGWLWALGLVSVTGCSKPNPLHGLTAAGSGTADGTGTESDSSTSTTGQGSSVSASGAATTDVSAGSTGGSSQTQTDSGSESDTVCGIDPDLLTYVVDADPVPALSSGMTEMDPFLSYDGSRMYLGMSVEYAAPRSIRVSVRGMDGSFGPPMETPDGISAQEDVLKIVYSADELSAVITGQLGGSSQYQLWLLRRENTGATFSFPDDFTELGTLATGGHNYDPHLSADGLRLYYSPQFGAGTDQAIYLATRPGTDAAFTTGAMLTELDLPDQGEADPALTEDERLILFSAVDETGQVAMWTSFRTDADGPFGTPRLLGRYGFAGAVGHPTVSADGCEVWFVNDDRGTRDIWHGVAAVGS